MTLLAMICETVQKSVGSALNHLVGKVSKEYIFRVIANTFDDGAYRPVVIGLSDLNRHKNR